MLQLYAALVFCFPVNKVLTCHKHSITTDTGRPGTSHYYIPLNFIYSLTDSSLTPELISYGLDTWGGGDVARSLFISNGVRATK